MGLAAEQESGDAATAVRGHEDEVAAVALGAIDDCLPRCVAHDGVGVARHVFLFRHRLDFGEDPVGFHYCTKEIINIIKDNVKTLLINKVEFLNKFTNNCDLDEVINAINAMKEKNDKLINELAIFKDNYNAVINSRMWRFTKPFRKFNGFVKKVLMLTPVTRIPIKVLLSIKRNGVKNTAKKLKLRFIKSRG